MVSELFSQRRVAVTHVTVRQLVESGSEVMVEKVSREFASLPDGAYAPKRAR